MTITQRLYLTFSLLSVAIITLVISSSIVLTGFQTRFQYVQDNIIPSVAILDDMIIDSNQLVILLYRHQSSTSVYEQDALEKSINYQINTIKSKNKKYLDSYTSNDEDENLCRQAFVSIENIQSKLPQFFSGSKRQDDSITLTSLNGNDGLGAAVRKLKDGFDEQRKLSIDISNSYQKVNLKTYKMTIWTLVLASSAGIIILGFFSIKTISGIRSQLKEIYTMMHNASEHLDLTLRADDTKKNEIGLMANAYNHLITNVSDSLAAVRSSAESIANASVQIAAGNEDLSSRTEQQAASLEQTAASMSQLSTTVRQTAESTQLASQLSNNARKISGDSSTQIKNMLVTMGNIKSSSAKITDIISLIEGIAFQTNILALNAAVEAARAGEQGLGFAVVAGEVRNLSQRVSASAREIKVLIEASLLHVEEGASQAEDVGNNISRMNDAVRQVSSLIDGISVAALEQSKGIEQVHLAVDQMDDVTQQNSALVQEASAASLSLTEQAASLNHLVGTFLIVKYIDGQESIQENFIATLQPKETTKGALYSIESDNWKSF